MGSRPRRTPGDGPADAAACLTARPKLRGPADVNTDSDLGKRWVREVGVLATCDSSARHSGRPLMINLVSRLMIARSFWLHFSRPKIAFSQLRDHFRRHADVTWG